MRLTFDIRLDGRPEMFSAFELLDLDFDWRDVPEAHFLRQELQRLVESELSDGLPSAGLSVTDVDLRLGSIEVVVHTALLAGAGIAVQFSPYLARQARDVAVQHVLIRCATSILRRLRGTSLGVSFPPPAYMSDHLIAAGDLLSVARRVATNEASLDGCGVSLTGVPIIQGNGYKAVFHAIGERCGGLEIAVTVAWHGQGYTVRRTNKKTVTA